MFDFCQMKNVEYYVWRPNLQLISIVYTKHYLINMSGCFPLGSKFPVTFKWEWRFSTEFFSLYHPSLLSMCPVKRTKHCFINMSGCLPLGSKFPVNFNWEWRVSMDPLSEMWI